MQGAFKEAISFAVLRLLVGACREFETRVCLEHETIFVSNVRSAVKYLCQEDHFQHIDGTDKSEARGWLGNLNTLYERMQEVSAGRHGALPVVAVSHCIVSCTMLNNPRNCCPCACSAKS